MAITKRDLARIISAKYSWPGYKVARMIELVMEEIERALLEGAPVSLRGFGTISVVTRPERGYFNPASMRKEITGERKVVTFKPSKVLLRRIKKGRG